MQKFLLFIFLILIMSSARAQFTENFSDGDFTSNPAWTGDDSQYKVNAALQLQLNGSGESIAALSAFDSIYPDMEWSFWIKLSLAPSDNNLARVYVSSDHADLKGELNGYYLKFGESGSNDAIELVKQSGTNHTVICRGNDGLIAASFAIRMKVTRSEEGTWSIYADPLGGVNYQFQASGNDNTYTSGSYLGVYSKFTSSNSTKFYYDDFYAAHLVTDTTPPEVVNVILNPTNLLTITFSEAVESVSASDSANYTITPDLVIPSSANVDLADPAIVYLTFANNFTPDVSYSLDIENVKDLAGNVMTKAGFPFSWHQVKNFDVLINEIMADPTPLVSLPDAEYIELYNRSDYPLDLKDWILVVGSSEKIMPGFTIPAGGYVILCDDGSKALLENYGSVITFSSFSVTNSGGTITLKDTDGQVIHSVSYTDNWYQTNYKKDGGWSLELIDPLNPCGEAANWIASKDNSGGTPGNLNSVNSVNPDLVPPAISRVGVYDATHITVWFTESCNYITISNPVNYAIDIGIGLPLSAVIQSPDNKVVSLTLSSPLVAGVLYTLTCTNTIRDCAGNMISSGTSALFAIPMEAMTNDIVINELLFDPAAGCVDFVEVYNRSSKVMDLKDLILADYDTSGKAITGYHEICSQSFLILPDTYFVLSTDSTSIRKYYKAANPLAFINMETFPEMNNDDGAIALALKGGEVIDLVAYTADMQYPLLTNVDGVSLERISSERSSGDATNWHSASESSGYGTPGYKNSQYGTIVTDENEIILTPEIFSPDNDGYNDNLTISYTFSTPGSNATITIYDATGRPVRNLVNHELCGTSGAFSWDGITNERKKAAIGRYIIFIEIFDLQGNVKRYKKGTVLGGKL